MDQAGNEPVDVHPPRPPSGLTQDLSPVNLIIFDIDGTLTQSVRVDEQCYVEAIEHTSSIRDIDQHWERYTYSTDSGLALQIFQEKLGRHPSLQEVKRVQTRFFELLDESFKIDPEACVAVPGAVDFLHRLKQTPGWAVALATGCWSGSAKRKLAAAGLPAAGLPMGTADDSYVRSEIIEIAMQRASATYRTSAFDAVVYVGDGVWDMKAARALGIGFVGITQGKHGARLWALGAEHLLLDFSDAAEAMARIETAAAAKASGA